MRELKLMVFLDSVKNLLFVLKLGSGMCACGRLGGIVTQYCSYADDDDEFEEVRMRTYIEPEFLFAHLVL